MVETWVASAPGTDLPRHCMQVRREQQADAQVPLMRSPPILPRRRHAPLVQGGASAKLPAAPPEIAVLHALTMWSQHTRVHCRSWRLARESRLRGSSLHCSAAGHLPELGQVYQLPSHSRALAQKTFPGRG